MEKQSCKLSYNAKSRQNCRKNIKCPQAPPEISIYMIDTPYIIKKIWGILLSVSVNPKRKTAVFMLFFMIISILIDPLVCLKTNAAEPAPDCESAVLMEEATGKVIYERNADERLAPASITKVMTLILIFEAMDKGQYGLKDEVSTSERAAGMGGSNVYLEPGETLSVEDMIKCICIASANDAAVAMAEFTCGTQEQFVDKMNEKAAALGMMNTHFVNSHGLDAKDHYSCARDIAIMSRELITKHPEITKYTTIWMDTIIHRTRRGEKEFGLNNTNKLIRTYKGITGLKTGSTDTAGFCLSATAKRNGVGLIAVVMKAKTPKIRFADCAGLLDYGFANCFVYQNSELDKKEFTVDVTEGKNDDVKGKLKNGFQHVFIGEDKRKEVTYKIMAKEVKAPVNEGDVIGRVEFFCENSKIGDVDILAVSDVERFTYKDCFRYVLEHFLI